MINKRTIEILKNEISCIRKANICDRKCEQCELVLPDTEIIVALEMAIQALSQESCDDAIGRKLAIRAIKNLYPDIPRVDFNGAKRKWADKYAQYIECERLIEQLPPVTQKSGKWIPVSEPPKELGTYLIQTDGEPYICQCRWTDVNPFWTDFKTKPHWNIFDLPQYSKVVAWMPLPTPYEPQESEEQTE